MRLWELNLVDTTGLPSYEIASKFVVRAPTARNARKLASKECGDEGPEVWLDAKRTSCTILNQAGLAKVIIRDSNHS